MIKIIKIKINKIKKIKKIKRNLLLYQEFLNWYYHKSMKIIKMIKLQNKNNNQNK